MVKIFELNAEGWEDWVSSRPPVVQDLCRRYPPDRLYRMEPTGQRVTLVSYSEKGTVTVRVSGDFNLTMFECDVFGVDPASLEECDLPADDEPTGVLLTIDEQINAYCELTRESNSDRCPECSKNETPSVGTGELLG